MLSFFCFLANPLDLALWTVCLSTNSRSVKENKLSGQRKIPAEVLSVTEGNVYLTMMQDYFTSKHTVSIFKSPLLRHS